MLGNDRTHVLVLNYVYNLPSFVKSKSSFAKVGKLIANDWQISGITTFQSGAPNNVSFSISGIGNLNERYTGSPDVGPRVVYKGPISYPKTQYAWMDASVLALPTVKGSQGFDSTRYPVRDPGFQNWDISIFKNIPLHGESMRMQLRVEMFNAWNHPEFNGWNTERDVQSGRPDHQSADRVGRQWRTVRIRRSHRDHGSAPNSVGGEVLLLMSAFVGQLGKLRAGCLPAQLAG